MHAIASRFLIVLVAIFTTGHAGHQRILEDEITEILECVRDVLKTGIEEVGLPSIEPLEIDHLVVNLTQLNIKDATGHVTLDKASIGGFTDWVLSDLKIGVNVIGGLGGSLVANIDLPSFTIRTDYVADVSISSVNVFGAGEISIELGHLGASVDAKVLLNRITLSKFRILPTLEAINFKITGLLNDEEHSEMASQIVNDIAVGWINQKSEDFADLIEQVVQGLINGIQDQREGIDVGEIINAVLERCPLPIK